MHLLRADYLEWSILHKLIKKVIFELTVAALLLPFILLSGDHPSPEHLVQPLDLLQRGGLGNRLLDGSDLIRSQSGGVGSRPSPRGKRLARSERFGALFDLFQLILALLALEQGLGGLALLGLHLFKV